MDYDRSAPVPIDPRLRTTAVNTYEFARTVAESKAHAATESDRQRAEAAALPTVGDIIGEHYRLVRILGEGMFGKVYVAARLDVPEHQVALKLLPRSLYVGRNVERELVMLATVGHPNVVQLKDHGTGADYVWLTMPVYRGETLAERLVRGPLGLREAHDIFLPIARGVEALHDAGLRHQDVKPENIYLAQFGGRVHPILLDLGVAAERESPFVAGTVLYASPEQVCALSGFPGTVELTERMDTYCLATTLLMALVGPDGFLGTSAHSRDELDEAHRQRAAEPLPGVALPGLVGRPRALLEEAFRGWLALEAAERPSMSEVAEQLDVLLEPEREEARAEDRRHARARASLQRVRLVAGGMLLAGIAVGALLVAKRETLRLAHELDEARNGRAESFDKLDTCIASYRMASDDAAACTVAREQEQGEFRRALGELEKNGGAAESERARQLQLYAGRAKACEEGAAALRERCADAQTQLASACAAEKAKLSAARDEARASAEARAGEAAAGDRQLDLCMADRTAFQIERDACRTSTPVAPAPAGRPASLPATVLSRPAESARPEAVPPDLPAHVPSSTLPEPPAVALPSAEPPPAAPASAGPPVPFSPAAP